MKFSHLYLLSAMLLLVPVVAPAQAASHAAGGSEVATQGSAHVSIEWAKSRLDEMDVTLSSLEEKLGDLKSESRAEAERAIATMREHRDALKQDIEEKSQAGEADFQEMKTAVESRWTAFEAGVQQWMDAAGEQVADRKAMFDARAAAQLRAWQAMIDNLEASAKGVAADRKQEIDAAVAAIRADADAAKVRLEALKQSGEESWTALSGALAESRAAFDRASRTASEAFSRATN